jgi:hypothetical protein
MIDVALVSSRAAQMARDLSINDEARMTNDENRAATRRALISAFVFRHSFDIRHSGFVIYSPVLRLRDSG